MSAGQTIAERGNDCFVSRAAVPSRPELYRWVGWTAGTGQCSLLPASGGWASANAIFKTMSEPITDSAARATSPSTGAVPDGGFNALVPELDVSNLAASLRFWCELLGFEVAYDRPAARFAYLHRGPI